MHHRFSFLRILPMVMRAAVPVALGLACGLGTVTRVHADWKEDVDYNKLVNMLGGNLPDGSGVPISIVEALDAVSNNYKPNLAGAEFTDVNFTDGSNNACTGGVCTGFSLHANGQSMRFFGNTTSISPGANDVTLYEALDYLDNVLKRSGGTPLTQNFRVQNHSWAVNTLGSASLDRTALRRFDGVIERDNVTAIVGLGNSLSALPSLLSHSYNAIALGRSDGFHSVGLTTLSGYGPGRSKPDLVSPSILTSRAASRTSSVATFLHSSPAVVGTDAANSGTMKSILMAGATKEEFPGWSRDPNQPLDDTFGAGEINVYNSYLITEGGQFPGSTTTPTPVDSYGWDYQEVTSASDRLYEIEIPVGSTATELSIILTWNVDISPSFNSQTLANLDLTLRDDMGAIVDESISSVDNVEHIYIGANQAVTQLDPGIYTLEVSTDFSRDYGIAWRTTTLFDDASADFDEDGDVDGNDFLIWQRGRGTLLGAAHGDGDADGDGDVDDNDLAIFETDYGSLAPLVSLVGVPEPAALALAAAGCAMLLFLRKRLG